MFETTASFLQIAIPSFDILSPQNKVLYQPLAEIDPEVKNIIDKETWRQFTGLELIASEVRSLAVWDDATHCSQELSRI